MKKIVVIEIGVMRIFVVLLQLLFLKIYTNHTSIYELGIYYFLFTLSYSLNAFLLVPLDYFQQSQLYLLKKLGASLRSFLGINKNVLKISAALVVLSIIVCYFVDPADTKLIPIIVLLALSTYLVTLLRGFVNNLEQRRAAIYTLLLEGVLKIVLYILYLKFLTPSAFLILGALLSASFITLIILLIIVKNTKEYKYDKLQVFPSNQIIKFAYPISVGAVINWIQLQGYRMILVPLGLVEIVGIYGTVANVGISGMNALSTIYSQLFVPNLYKTHGAYIKKYLTYAIVCIIVVITVGLTFSHLIIGLLTKSTFVKYSWLILYGIISEAGNFLIGGLTIYLTIKNLTKATLKASITGLVAFFMSFGLLYLLHFVNVYTIGLPIIFTQMVITIYLAIIVYRIRK